MHIPEDEAERRRLNERGREILRRKNGAVRPHCEDGYVNLLNKYGTKQDNSEAYKFEREPVIPDMQLTGLYEGNGLFSKIIDTPAEEALKHGFDLNLKSDELNAFVEDALDDLEWEERAATAIKWARLYGGALIVPVSTNRTSRTYWNFSKRNAPCTSVPCSPISQEATRPCMTSSHWDKYICSSA